MANRTSTSARHHNKPRPRAAHPTPTTASPTIHGANNAPIAARSARRARTAKYAHMHATPVCAQRSLPTHPQRPAQALPPDLNDNTFHPTGTSPHRRNLTDRTEKSPRQAQIHNRKPRRQPTSISQSSMRLRRPAMIPLTTEQRKQQQHTKSRKSLRHNRAQPLKTTTLPQRPSERDCRPANLHRHSPHPIWKPHRNTPKRPDPPSRGNPLRQTKHRTHNRIHRAPPRKRAKRLPAHQAQSETNDTLLNSRKSKTQGCFNHG